MRVEPGRVELAVGGQDAERDRQVEANRDSLGRSAGARLTVMRLLCGKAKPLVASAARTRSRDSLTSVSASPTSVKLGRPLARCTSTCTAGASSPSSERLWMTASDTRYLRFFSGS
jgi:hypothetical protein